MVDIRNRPHRPTRGPAIQPTGDVVPQLPSSARARILRPIVPGSPASPSQFDTAPNPASTVPQVQPAAPVAPNPFIGFQPQVSPVAIVPAPPVIPPLQPAPQVAIQQEAQQAFAGVQPAGAGETADANAILARGQALAAAQAGQPSGIPQAVRRGLGLGDVLPVGGGQREFGGRGISQGSLPIASTRGGEGSGIGGGDRNLIVGTDAQGNPISQFQLIQQRNISAGSERVQREQAKVAQNRLLEGARFAAQQGDTQTMAALVAQAAQTEIPGVGPAQALQDLQGEDPLAALAANPQALQQLLKQAGERERQKSIGDRTEKTIKSREKLAEAGVKFDREKLQLDHDFKNKEFNLKRDELNDKAATRAAAMTDPDKRRFESKMKEAAIMAAQGENLDKVRGLFRQAEAGLDQAEKRAKGRAAATDVGAAKVAGSSKSNPIKLPAGTILTQQNVKKGTWVQIGDNPPQFVN